MVWLGLKNQPRLMCLQEGADGILPALWADLEVVSFVREGSAAPLTSSDFSRLHLWNFFEQ